VCVSEIWFDCAILEEASKEIRLQEIDKKLNVEKEIIFEYKID
jgi:hypothetical protein